MDIEATATIAHTEVTPDLITDALTEAHHVIDTQVLIIIDGTHHTEGHHHIEVPPLTPETAADLDHIHHTNPVEQHLLNLHPGLTKTTSKCQDRKHKRVIIDDLQSDYYSSDNTSSDSNDDLN